MTSSLTNFYTLNQIDALIPPKAKELWNQTSYRKILGISSAALATGVSCYLGYRWITKERFSQTSATSSSSPTLPTPMSTTISANAECLVSDETMNVLKREAEQLAPCEGLIVNNRRFLVVREENNSLDVYLLNKKGRYLGEGGQGHVSQLFSVIGHNWNKAMKTGSREVIENGLAMVGIVNPDGKTRGCIKKPYRVIDKLYGDQIGWELMDTYDSDAHVAMDNGKILDQLNKHPNSEPYFVDIVHQGLSVLAKLEEVGIRHSDLREVNVFVSRSKDGFIDFHLGDWEMAKRQQTREPGWNSREIFDMHSLFHLITQRKLYSKFSYPFNNILLQMPFTPSEKCNIRSLLEQCNTQIIKKANDPNAPTIWKQVARRAGLVQESIFGRVVQNEFNAPTIWKQVAWRARSIQESVFERIQYATNRLKRAIDPGYFGHGLIGRARLVQKSVLEQVQYSVHRVKRALF